MEIIQENIQYILIGLGALIAIIGIVLVVKAKKSKPAKAPKAAKAGKAPSKTTDTVEMEVDKGLLDSEPAAKPKVKKAAPAPPPPPMPEPKVSSEEPGEIGDISFDSDDLGDLLEAEEEGKKAAAEAMVEVALDRPDAAEEAVEVELDAPAKAAPTEADLGEVEIAFDEADAGDGGLGDVEIAFDDDGIDDAGDGGEIDLGDVEIAFDEPDEPSPAAGVEPDEDIAAVEAALAQASSGQGEVEIALDKDPGAELAAQAKKAVEKKEKKKKDGPMSEEDEFKDEVNNAVDALFGDDF